VRPGSRSRALEPTEFTLIENQLSGNTPRLAGDPESRLRGVRRRAHLGDRASSMKIAG
jgi:hypothetical protein